MGGLSKKSSFLKKYDSSTTTLKVDAGTLLFDEKVASQPQLLPQAIINASAIVEAYNLMGYDAVAVGRQDLAAGLKPLQALARKASFPFLSANLVDIQGAPLFTPVFYTKRAGIRIALIGLTGHRNLAEKLSDSATILPWQDVLPQMLTRISAKSDLIILLSNLSAPENRAIAKQIPDIHIIFQSGVSKNNLPPQLINNTLIAQVGHDGKYQGQLTTNWTASQKWQQDKKPLLAMQKEYDRLTWMIDKVNKKGGPQVVYKNNDARRQSFAQKLARHSELAREIKAQANKQGQEESSNLATYSNSSHPLSPSLANDRTIEQVLQRARQEANKTRKKKGNTQKFKQYTGSISCQKCHKEIYNSWSKTAHASSYQTLKKRDQNNNQSCVYCHVTGLDEATAHLASSLPETMKAVGCEVCHGPGRQHATAASLKDVARQPPTPQLCLKCHSQEHDDNFDYEQDKKKVH